jgi:delta 1-pyrroline-5-carboxylate dehydrogenase
VFTTEYFGPILAVHVYDDGAFESVVDQAADVAPYALTGSVMATDRAAIAAASARLRYSAGNFYVNDKPTGAVVGQQPFGGARASGTNDKAGSVFNLIRWVSPRTIKETFVPPVDYRYPHMGLPLARSARRSRTASGESQRCELGLWLLGRGVSHAGAFPGTLDPGPRETPGPPPWP